jgi:hypothetical protein
VNLASLWGSINGSHVVQGIIVGAALAHIPANRIIGQGIE